MGKKANLDIKKPMAELKKLLPKAFNDLSAGLNKNSYNSVDLDFQDESRFGLMDHVGKCATALGLRPVVISINCIYLGFAENPVFILLYK